jgi:hypothetical protein
MYKLQTFCHYFCYINACYKKMSQIAKRKGFTVWYQTHHRQLFFWAVISSENLSELEEQKV